MEPIFEGCAVALVLPMLDDGSIDYDGFKRQVQRMIDSGMNALLVNGTTGETPTITMEEEFQLTKIVKEMCKGTKIKVIAGAGSNDTMIALQKAKFAQSLGVDAILCVTPYYNKTSQKGLIEHYTYIADRVDVPMIIYNVPGRTGMTIAVDTVKELAQHKNICGMKDATNNMVYMMDVLSCTKNLDFHLYTGCDENILPYLLSGGKGVISVLANVYPKETLKYVQAIMDKDLVMARQMAYDFNDVCHALFMDVNPIMPKAALKYLGICGEMVRRPLIPTSEEKKKQLFETMRVFENKGY